MTLYTVIIRKNSNQYDTKTLKILSFNRATIEKLIAVKYPSYNVSKIKA